MNSESHPYRVGCRACYDKDQTIRWLNQRLYDTRKTRDRHAEHKFGALVWLLIGALGLVWTLVDLVINVLPWSGTPAPYLTLLNLIICGASMYAYDEGLYRLGELERR